MRSSASKSHLLFPLLSQILNVNTKGEVIAYQGLWYTQRTILLRLSSVQEFGSVCPRTKRGQKEKKKKKKSKGSCMFTWTHNRKGKKEIRI